MLYKDLSPDTCYDHPDCLHKGDYIVLVLFVLGHSMTIVVLFLRHLVSEE